jgi:putative oxidoreductase
MTLGGPTVSSSFTPPTRPTGYTTSGATDTVDRDDDRVADDPGVKPVKPRGHVRDDLGLLVLRLGLAAVMIAHGYQKFFLQGGFGGTTQAFTQMGLPYPQVSAVLVIVLELAGGVALVFGLFTVLVGLAYAVAMAGAVWFVHLSNGFFVAQNGYELAGLTGVVALVLAITGAGTISLDRALFGGKRRRRVREARDAGLV